MSLFGHRSDTYPFEIFSLYHLVTQAVFLLISILIYVYRTPLSNHEKIVRYTMFTLLFGLEALYHIWLFKGGVWDLSFTLPLQLCSISLLLCCVLLLTNSKVLFQIVYFLGIAGAMQALITPELFLGFPHFRFIQFFLTHMLIIWVALFYVFVQKYKPTWRGLLQAFLFLNVAAGVAYIANKLTLGNYMFLAQKPTNASLLDYLGPYPYYILSLEGIAFTLFVMMFIPFWLRERMKMRQESNS